MSIYHKQVFATTGSLLMVGLGVALLFWANRSSYKNVGWPAAKPQGKLGFATALAAAFAALHGNSAQAQQTMNVRSVAVQPHPFGVKKPKHAVMSRSPLAVNPQLVSTPTKLPVWSVSFTNVGYQYNVSFVGNAPSSNTTTAIETNVVPVRIVLCRDGSDPCAPANIAFTYDPTKPLRKNPAGVTLSATAATLSSPIFQNANYTTSAGTLVGTTQYADAMLRASFWNYPGNSASTNSNWHTRWQYSLKSPITITMPNTDWDTSSTADFGKINLYRLFSLFDGEASKYLPGQFTFFLLYNVATTLGPGGQCCVLGFHTSDGQNPAPSRTYAVASYLDPTSNLPAAYADTGAHIP